MKRGLAVAATGAYDKTKNDVGEAVKAIAAADPQAVVMVSTCKPTAAFVKALRAASETAAVLRAVGGGLKALQAEMGAQAAGNRHLAKWCLTRGAVPRRWYANSKRCRRQCSRKPASPTTHWRYIAAKVMVEGAPGRAASDAGKAGGGAVGVRLYDVGGFVVDYWKRQQAWLPLR